MCFSVYICNVCVFVQCLHTYAWLSLKINCGGRRCDALYVKQVVSRLLLDLRCSC